MSTYRPTLRAAENLHLCRRYIRNGVLDERDRADMARQARDTRRGKLRNVLYGQEAL